MNNQYQYIQIEPFERRDFDILVREYCVNCGKLVRESSLKNEWKTVMFIEFCFECWRDKCQVIL